MVSAVSAVLAASAAQGLGKDRNVRVGLQSLSRRHTPSCLPTETGPTRPVVRTRQIATLPGPCGGLSAFGDRKIEVSPGDGPEIRIDGFSLLGDVEVTDGPGVMNA